MAATLFDEQQYMPQELRPYQREAVDAVHHSHQNGGQAPLLSMPTGTGKTTVIAQALQEAVDPSHQRALVVGHTEEIIFQLHDRILNQSGGALANHFEVNDKLYPGIGIVMADNNEADARVVVATRQSLHPKRLQQLAQHGRIDLLVIDEGHHATNDNTYGSIVSCLRGTNPDLKILGVTATPARNDKKALASIFSHIAYEWSIQDAIEAGYLVPVTRVVVGTQVDMNSVRSVGGDYNQKAMVSILDAANWVELTMDAFRQHVQPLQRPTLAFMPSVDMSERFVRELMRHDVSAVHIDGETPKQVRREMLREYAAGNIQLISNFGIFTEGFDAPATGCIFLARPTRSRILLTQIVGRGLRIYPGKQDCVVVDLTVRDTKVLTAGTLIGDMVGCANCGAQYYKGFMACPQCGHVPQREQRDMFARFFGEGGDGAPDKQRDFAGLGLLAATGSMFEDAFSAWYSADGYFSCSAGDEGTFVIMPPLVDDYYRLVCVPKNWRDPIMVYERNDDLASLVMAGDKRVKGLAAGLADRNAAWRNRPPSDKQIEFLRKLGGKVESGMTMGDVSLLISHKQAVGQIKKSMGALKQAFAQDKVPAG